MYVNIKSGIKFHYYGEILYVILENGNLILLNEIETYFIEKVFKCTKLNLLKSSLMKENEITSEQTENFLESILDNLKDVLYIDPNIADRNVFVSGEKGALYPINLVISLTNNCCQKCIHCFKGEIKSQISLDYELLNNFLESLVGKVPNLQFTGGEPLLYPGLVNLLKKFSDYYNISITTSGYYLTNELVIALSKVKLVQVSLYSNDLAYHDYFTATPGSFQKVTYNLKWMLKNKINVKVSTLITPYNVNSLDDFVEFCIRLGIKQLKMGIIKPVGRAEGNERVCFAKGELLKLMKKVNILRKKYIKNIYIEDWGTETIEVKSFSCGAGKTTLTIMENGDIQPCGFIVKDYLSMGNLNNNDFQKIIRSDSSYNNMLIRYEKKNGNNNFAELCNILC